MQSAWDNFWTGYEQRAALAEACSDAPILQNGWREYFSTQREIHPDGSLLDLASGTGEVALLAREVMGAETALSCLDYSAAAIEQLKSEGKISHAIVGDAADLPFADKSFDMVVSLYGVEYAGEGAFREAARVTASGGSIRLVTHALGGAIWTACQMNGLAAGEILKSGIFDAARHTFETLEQIRIGEADQQALAGPHGEVKACVPALQKAIADAASGSAARGLGERLYTDFTQIFSRMAAYDPQDILNWCDAMSAEIMAYQTRMSAMTSAALSSEDAIRLTDIMQDTGLEMTPPAQVLTEGDQIAWVLEGKRPL